MGRRMSLGTFRCTISVSYEGLLGPYYWATTNPESLYFDCFANSYGIEIGMDVLVYDV